MKDKVVIALDLGGTNARMAAVRADGEIVSRLRCETPKDATGGQIVDLIVSLANQCRDALAEDVAVVAFAAAVPATINASNGVLTKLPNLHELEGINLRLILQERLELKVFLENDATSATIGEHWRGASRGVDNVIGVTLGTGVGGGLIVDGRPLRGKDGTAGEVGHVCVEPRGHPCGCGSRGCVEQYSSGTAIVRMAIEKGITATSPKQIYEAAISGDDRAKAVFATMGAYLGIAIAGLINVLNPEMIVLGGGVAAGWDLFIENVRDEVRSRAFCEPAERAKIVRASLGDDAGTVGAANVAFSGIG